MVSARTVVLDELLLPAVWLRDACDCPQCRHPGNGQRLGGTGRLDLDAAVTWHEVRDGYLTTVFAPDGHSGRFALDWLAAHAPGRPVRAGDRSERTRAMWTAADFPAGPPRLPWDVYLASNSKKSAALGAVADLGVVMLTHVPVEAGTVLDVARTFGYVRTTNYGEVFDVQVEPDPANLADTDLALAPHTDNPYRDPAPTVQLLHCLRAAPDGGHTVLVDGFAAARRLRESHPAAFATLSEVPLPFAYDSATASLASYRPVISLDAGGGVTQIRWNHRSMRPPQAAPERIPEIYQAIRAFADLLRDDDLTITVRLAPGDCLIFDNTRILHGRTAFTTAPADGPRHLQGCYADLDGLYSTLAVLRREAPAAPTGERRGP